MVFHFAVFGLCGILVEIKKVRSRCDIRGGADVETYVEIGEGIALAFVAVEDFSNLGRKAGEAARRGVQRVVIE